jgi:tetratricopeptide (TPR) repeat protein
MNNLSNVYLTAGRYDKAEALHRQALSLRERVLGREHPETLRSLYNLACVAALQGRRDEAFQHLRDAVARGYSNATALREDTDLASMRGDPEFDKIVASAEKNQTRTAARD